MKIGIIGGGISGLASAYLLSKRGHAVTLFEKGPMLGGLASSFEMNGHTVDRFYHFLCQGDDAYISLCRELGIHGKLHWRPAPTGFYYQGKHYGFSGPLDLLRFDPIPLTQRLRFGLFALEARWRSEWAQLDSLPGTPWLIDRLGKRAYEVIWHPLLALKFGEIHEQISAAWVWHRIHRVARSKGRMGYVERGSAAIMEALAAALEQQNCSIRLDSPIARMQVAEDRVTGLELTDGSTESFDHVISTIPLPLAAKMIDHALPETAVDLRKVEYVGVRCVVMRLARGVTPNFWLNVHDDRMPFNGIIEYSNLNKSVCGPDHLVYVPFYVPTNHAIYQMDEEALFELSWDAVSRLRPGLGRTDILEYHVSQEPYGQAVCRVGFLDVLERCRNGAPGLTLLDSAFLYPEDRSLSALMTLAAERVREIG